MSSYGQNIDKDDDGKSLYGYLLNEVRSVRKDRDDIVDLVVRFIFDNDSDSVDKLSKYIEENILDM